MISGDKLMEEIEAGLLKIGGHAHGDGFTVYVYPPTKIDRELKLKLKIDYDRPRKRVMSITQLYRTMVNTLESMSMETKLDDTLTIPNFQYGNATLKFYLLAEVRDTTSMLVQFVPKSDEEFELMAYEIWDRSDDVVKWLLRLGIELAKKLKD